MPKTIVSKIVNIASALAIISPLLAMYGTGISTITLLDCSIAIVLILIIISCWNGVKLRIESKNRSLFFVLSYIWLNFLLQVFSYSDGECVDVLLRTLRYSYYLCFVIVLCGGFFNYELAMKIYRVISIFATVYLFLQFMSLFIFNYSLRGYVSFLPLMRPELATFTENLQANMYARPRSIFGEPSQYALYVLGYLSASFFGHRKNSFFESALLSVGLLLSASTTAIITVIILWGIKLFDYMKYKKQGAVIMLLGMVLLMLCSAIGIIKTSRFALFVGRLPSSLANRMAGFADYGANFFSMSLKEMVFGIGMNVDALNAWYSGLIKILCYFGIIGLFIYVILICGGIITLQKVQRRLLAVMVLLGVFSELLVSNWLILFLPFILCQELSWHPGYGQVERRKFGPAGR